MVVLLKATVWSVMVAAPWMVYMTAKGYPWDDIEVLGMSVLAGAWILLVSIAMRFKACKN